MDQTLRTRDELTALYGLLTAAMADCDVPGADAADREEWQRLLRYQAALQDAIRGVQTVNWHPDTQAMADWLAGEGPNPLTVLGHSQGWRTTLPEEATGDGEGLTITAITADEMPGYLDRLLGEDGRTTAPAAQAPQAGPPDGGNWMAEVLDLAEPVAGQAPAPYVPPHPVTAESRSARQGMNPPVRGHAAPGRDRIWLDVPYPDKDIAKRRGAIWDPVHQSWYAPHRGIAGLVPWSQLPEVLAGEDRTLGQGLFVDLIPRTSWFTNVRSAVRERDWFRVRSMVYRRAGQRCEACGAGAAKDAGRFLECHERFVYHSQSGVGSGLQMLRRLICLCSACHRVTHLGHTSLAGAQSEQAALAHLMSVTGMNAAQARVHVQDAFMLWEQRSQRPWMVDLSMIARAGIGTHEFGEGERKAWAS
jgi:Domain of unknown function (DUF5710)